MSDAPPLPTDSPFQTVAIRRFKAGSLFKFILAVSCTTFFPLSLLCGILAIFGAKTVQLNGQHVTGLPGLLTAIFLLAPVMVVITSCFAWLPTYLATRLLGRVSPLTLEFEVARPAPAANPAPAP